MNLGILGGDRRQISMIQELSKRGFSLLTWGVEEIASIVGINSHATAAEVIEWADVLILPLPASRDGVHVSTTVTDAEPLRLDTVFAAHHDRLILAGSLSPTLLHRAEEYGARVLDYYEDEILQLQNALPSAEGAIEIAMHELPTVLSGTPVAVFGYGRIGELLARKLLALGADVTVYARREEVLTRAALAGCRCERILTQNGRAYPEHLLRDIRVIFNTVPHCILEGEHLAALSEDCLYIELASPPGGLDWEAAKRLGVRALWGSGLPGKYAPESAGTYLAAAVMRILQQEGRLSH